MKMPKRYVGSPLFSIFFFLFKVSFISIILCTFANRDDVAPTDQSKDWLFRNYVYNSMKRTA